MTADFERRLRETLRAEAHSVEPDPQAWNRVEARIRRAQWTRWSLAAAGAAAVAAGAVLVGPGLFDTEVTFAPEPAEQPAPEAVEEPGSEPEAPSGPTCASSEIVAVVAGDDGLYGLCSDLSHGAFAGAASAHDVTFAPDASGVVYERGDEGQELLVWVDLAGGFEDASEQVLGGGRLPAFAPDGRLARVLGEGDESEIVVGAPFSEPTHALLVPADIDALTWDPLEDRLLFAVEEPGGHALYSWRLDAAEPVRLTEPEDGLREPAFTADGSLGAIEVGADGTSVAVVVLDRAVLDGAAVDHDVVVDYTTVTAVTAADAPRLRPAGMLSIDDEGPALLHGERPAWFVGVDDDLVLVTRTARGSTTASLTIAGARLAAAPLTHAPGGPAAAAADPLPDAVSHKRDDILQAAGARDNEAITWLMEEEFTYDFGLEPDRVQAGKLLYDRPELYDVIVRVLEQPHGVIEGGLYVWPRAHAIPDPQDWTAEDLDALSAIDPDFDPEAVTGEGYTGYRIGITERGEWVFFVAGD